MNRYLTLQEKEDTFIIKDMKAFGLSSSDIDSDGYVTLYHGGVKLPSTLKKNEIFFMTASDREAEEYAQMRKGRIFKLKVKPEDVNWNQGSYEIEYTKGGKIINGTIIPPEAKVTFKRVGTESEYKGVKVGDVMPKSKFKVMDIVVHDKDHAQFLMNTAKRNIWYDAQGVLEYEKI